MIRVNLLPWREQRHKTQQTQFFIALGVVAAIGIAIWFAVHTVLDDQFNNQQNRNKYLEEEIAKLEKEIKEIEKLKGDMAALLARKKVVETLQSNRAEVVHLLDQLTRQLPDGIYLKGIKQTGNKVTINGFTQSQARVSTLMRNLESSQHLESPALVEIKAVPQGTSRANEFTMNINIQRPKEDEAGKPAAGKPAAKPPAKG